MNEPEPGSRHEGPRRPVGVWQAVSVCVGMVIGAGIFRSPSIVAANVGSETEALLACTFGGVMSLAGALCFAEMAAAFPDAGGDCHFLRRAFGARAGFLFASSRFAVILTGVGADTSGTWPTTTLTCTLLAADGAFLPEGSFVALPAVPKAAASSPATGCEPPWRSRR